MRVLVLVAVCSAVLACSASQEAVPDPDVTGGSGGQGGAASGGGGGVSTGGGGPGQDGPEVKTVVCNQQMANGQGYVVVDFPGATLEDLMLARSWVPPLVNDTLPPGTTLRPGTVTIVDSDTLAAFCELNAEVTFLVP